MCITNKEKIIKTAPHKWWAPELYLWSVNVFLILMGILWNSIVWYNNVLSSILGVIENFNVSWSEDILFKFKMVYLILLIWWCIGVCRCWETFMENKAGSDISPVVFRLAPANLCRRNINRKAAQRGKMIVHYFIMND